MKKYAFILASLVLYALPVLAFGPGNLSGTWEEGAVRKGVKKGVEIGINDKLKKENCHFTDNNTDRNIACNSGGIDRIVKYLGDWKAGLENTVANSVNVTIRTHGKNYDLANKRVRYVESKIREKFGYWHYYVEAKEGEGNNLNISVSVH